jgi:beta-ureidopropionase / N-carbamoyl-L-amino-acid hydrolase
MSGVGPGGRPPQTPPAGHGPGGRPPQTPPAGYGPGGRPPLSASTFAELWRELEPIGRDPQTGGYRRYSWTPADTACRAWFTGQATKRGLDVETDNNGNLWAWWDPKAPEGPKRPGAVVTGSHLDSVPDGGAFDGPLGVVSALAAVDLLKEKTFSPERPVVLAVFTEEEGARFGLPCLGSRLLASAVDPDAARVLTDDAGTTLADAMIAAGHDPGYLGPREDLLDGIGAFVELHVEQGRALAPMGATLGLAEGIWPHGRWRFVFGGRADHAGTARLTDRRDPMLPYAGTALAARRAAEQNGSVATFGKVIVEPNGTNAVPSAVHAWLDARAADDATVQDTITMVRSAAESFCEEHGVALSVRQESFTPLVRFDEALRDRIAAALAAAGFSAPTLPTGAGHDAGILAARIPTAMLFVRNPTGVSHSPAEHADLADCEAGVHALAAVLEDLAGPA